LEYPEKDIVSFVRRAWRSPIDTFWRLTVFGGHIQDHMHLQESEQEFPDLDERLDSTSIDWGVDQRGRETGNSWKSGKDRITR
jgi:hypothetical protein